MSREKYKDVECTPALRRLLIELEENCTADCCKSSAFNLSTKKIKTWINRESVSLKNEIYNELFEIKKLSLNEHTHVNLNVRGLESKWKTEEFISFVEALITKFHNAVYKNS